MTDNYYSSDSTDEEVVHTSEDYLNNSHTKHILETHFYYDSDNDPKCGLFLTKYIYTYYPDNQQKSWVSYTRGSESQEFTPADSSFSNYR